MLLLLIVYKKKELLFWVKPTSANGPITYAVVVQMVIVRWEDKLLTPMEEDFLIPVVLALEVERQ